MIKVLVMSSKKLRFGLFSLLTLFALGTHAQMGKLFDADKQMSSSYTTQVYLDRDGFIWVATRNGLNRYDGYQFRILKKEIRQDIGMASNYVNCMMQDRNGLFYIGMYGAFQTYDGERFHDVKTCDLDNRVVPCYVTCLLERHNGDVLIGTSGHGLLRMTAPQEARQEGGALANITTIHHMMEDRQQRLWIATDNQGLLRWDGKNLKRYFQEGDGDDQSAGLMNSIVDVCEDNDGHIFVATTSHGLFRLDGDTPVHIDATGNKHISVLYVNRRGHIMIGYDGMGLAIYNPKEGRLLDNPYFSRDVDLSMAKVYSICEDLSGNVWLGLLQKGIYMQPSHTIGFGYLGYKLGSRNIIGTACVTSVQGGSNGYHWIGTDKDGLYVLDSSNSRVIKHFKENFPATILGLCEDLQGRIWVASYKEGTGWIDPKTMTWHPYSLPQGLAVSIFDLTCDREGHIWFGTMGYGLLRLNFETGDIKAYTQDDKAPYDRNVNSIVNNYISQIAISPDGKRIYTATTMGVCAMDLEKENWLSSFGTNCLNYGTPTRIAREFDGKLYIGTNDGLKCYDPKTRKMHTLGVESGLADNGIASIEQDKQGLLWISTDHGLCCMDPKTNKTKNYFVDNGLQSNEFSDGASWITPNGQIVFGGLGGITWFRPADIQEREWKAEVKLTGFTVNGESVSPATMSGFWRVTDRPVIASNKFVLSSGDNNFALQMSTLTYDNPEHIVYLYRINHEEWVRMQPGVNEITFSHLAPGDYDFCVVAEQNGVQTPERCFTVVIHAPWYRSTLAYLFYVLALIALFLWYRQQHKRKEQDRLRLQEHIHAEEMADAKLKFFMNISHEVRTPMTLIVTPLLSLIKQDDDPHRRSVYETIRRNAERILGLINQMMDLRKIDKGQMQMHMCETELISFVDDIHTLFAQQAKAKNIQFTYEHDTEELPVWIDRNNFDKVIVNLLSNAFKFTPTGGNVHIGITHDAQQVHIAIKDTGEGIPEDKLDRIFERFYQSPTHANDRKTGTGIGLDLTRSLVELHHGTIKARNNVGEKGAEFIVTIPLGYAHLKPEEILTDVQEAPKAVELVQEESATEVLPEVKLPKAGKRQHIIVVEDDAEIRDYLVSALQEDYNVTACENGREGLTETLKTVPNLVISDIMMPEMDGNTMCSKIKQNPATSHVPVILLTAKSRDEDQLEGLEMGADAYIMKPFNMDILRRTIVNLIHTHQMLSLKFGRNDQLEEQVDDVKMKSPDDQLLERVMKVINKNIGNSDLSVDAIADEVGISRVHLHRKMKELTGQTPHDFIRNIRLKQAANLLASRNMNITEVMYACGFNNAASFSTIFKKFYGMSPREFMNEQHKK
jgi:signal transduction histidine kinase/ligand-binding sensor domain-containing protein/DNA-binding response OmpR family regulator